jgi:beta-glucanase (GH16 family)
MDDGELGETRIWSQHGGNVAVSATSIQPSDRARYTYSSCDVGILPNQTYTNGTGPEAALTSGAGGTSLSYLPGQRLSACTCQGEDHPGPSVNVGRGAVEIDMIEAQILIDQQVGQVSQSFQLAPFDDSYHFQNTTTDAPRRDETITTFNTYTGGTLQQAASALTTIDNAVYYDTSGEFRQFSMEWSADLDNHKDGYISWGSQGQESWTLHQSAIGPNKNVEIGSRLIAEEPMALVRTAHTLNNCPRLTPPQIFNLGMSNNFENVDFSHMTFPNYLRIDYIRVWQKSTGSITCDPPGEPAAKSCRAVAERVQNARPRTTSVGTRTPTRTPTTALGTLQVSRTALHGCTNANRIDCRLQVPQEQSHRLLDSTCYTPPKLAPSPASGRSAYTIGYPQHLTTPSRSYSIHTTPTAS